MCFPARWIRGKLPDRSGLMRVRPFRSPHHGASAPSLSGGGADPRPGELSLVHHGVLFLDELPEFSRHVLDLLRQPLEDGWVVVSRARHTVRLPARFALLAAMNPCPCGFRGDPRHECACTRRMVEAYRRRSSGPLLDRIDLHVDVPPLSWEDLAARTPGEPSAAVRARVIGARAIQAARGKRKICQPGNPCPAWVHASGIYWLDDGNTDSL